MNFTRFEELNGIQLGKFISDVIKRADFDEGVLAYYQRGRANFDAAHLEMIILLLEKLGTPVALNEVATLLDHSVKSVRYQAAQVIANAVSLDENVMSKVVRVLSNPPYGSDVIKIEEALYHGGTKEARAIAARFIESNRLQAHH